MAGLPKVVRAIRLFWLEAIEVFVANVEEKAA